jgi:hypothetical protein
MRSWPRTKKQQHSSKRIFERLRDEHGFTGGMTIVKDYVALCRQRSQEMFVPLVHPPGHAQVDFGEAIGIIGGVERKIHFLAFDLPQSDACFVIAYPAETTEAFCNGHVRGDGERQRTRVFSELQSHYLFEVGLAGLAKAMTRARSKALSVTRGATSWCRSRYLRASRPSTPIFATAAESAWGIACAATTRQSANGLSAIWQPSRSRFRRPTTPARSW